MSVSRTDLRSAWRWGILPAVVLAYFGLLLLPNWEPAMAASPVFLLYLFSLAAVVGLLLFFLVIAGISTGWAKLKRRRVPPAVLPLVLSTLASFACIGAVWLSARLVPRGLPTGSYLRKFDAMVWSDPLSTAYAEGDATPRQKMLGDVVTRLLKGRSRAEIERDLGPSLDTPYFRESGRDLIYALGPERDSIAGLDSEWLLVWLDEDNRFEKYAVWMD